MPAHRTDAALLNDIKGALEEIKRQTQTPRPEVYSASAVLKKFKLPPAFLTAIANLEWITMAKPGLEYNLGSRASRMRVYQWIAGIKHITDSDLVAIRDSYKLIESRQKEEVVNAKQGDTQITTTRKVNPFKDIKGTVFGYKQLKTIGETFRKSPTTVMIDDKFTIENVKLIKYEVQDSRLTLTFYMYADKEHNIDETSVICKIALDNMVIALSDRYASDNSSAMAIYTVPVRDPYNVLD